MKPRQTHPLDKKSPASRPNVRSASMRKLGKDGPSFTPTEKRKKDRLMKQFSRMGRKGYEISSGNSQAYQDGWERIFGGKRDA